MSIDDLLNKLEAAEREFQGTEFLAPIIGTNRVQVRIAGIVCQLKITKKLPAKYHGCGILRANSTKAATFQRPASLAEKDAYLRLFPAVRLILLQQRRNDWLAVPAHKGDSRFHIEGPVILRLPEEGMQRFETVIASFDGRLFYYRTREPARDPALAAYLREQIVQGGETDLPPSPETLHKRGLSAEERGAYALARTMLVDARRSQAETRLGDALAHAGAELRDYSERDDHYVVRYVVDGRTHVTTVGQDDLTVMTAGICLAGGDRAFDLASLVGVLQEAGQRNLLWYDGDEGRGDR